MLVKFEEVRSLAMVDTEEDYNQSWVLQGPLQHLHGGIDYRGSKEVG